MNKLAKLPILYLIVLSPFGLLLSQDEKYRSPMSFGTEADYIEYRMSRIIDVSITTSSNEIFAGKIFTMTDSSLAVCIFYSCYDWRTQPVLSFDYSEVNRLVIIKKKGQRLKGAGVGFLVGAAIGALWGYSDAKDCTGLCVIDPGSAAIFGGFLIGIPGAIIGWIASADTVEEEHYQINGNIDLFRNLHKKIGNEAIFYELPKNILNQD